MTPSTNEQWELFFFATNAEFQRAYETSAALYAHCCAAIRYLDWLRESIRNILNADGTGSWDGNYLMLADLRKLEKLFADYKLRRAEACNRGSQRAFEEALAESVTPTPPLPAWLACIYNTDQEFVDMLVEKEYGIGN